MSKIAGSRVRAQGQVAPGFEQVRGEFECNFVERGELGAAVSAYWRGRKVVDLWGGRRSPDRAAAWEEDTLTLVHSSTEGMSALALALAHSRGLFDYDAPVARYWPEFARHGKAAITVRQLLDREAGVWLDEKLSLDRLRDLDALARVLARQKPHWMSGTRHGAHALTLGLYMQEIFRRVDPARRTLGRFFHDEIAAPLQLDFYIGLPPELPSARLATLQPLTWSRALRALPTLPRPLLRRVLWPWSRLHESRLFGAVDWNDRRWLEVELPAANGVGTARAMAKLYSVYAQGGAELGIEPATMANLTAPPTVHTTKGAVLNAYDSLGFLRPGSRPAFGSSPRAFGARARTEGGSFGFADPDAQLGYAYVTNTTDLSMLNDPREQALRDAIYRAIAKLQAAEAVRSELEQISAET